jgi:tetratricopeptide (TPR) repeat protein
MSSLVTSVDDDLPKDGIPLLYFEQFIHECGGRSVLKNLSTQTVCLEFLLPRTKSSGLSFCKLLARDQPGLVKPANIFISHAWSDRFLEVVDAILHFFQGYDKDGKKEEDVVVWFDLFSNNQNKNHVINRDFTWWCNDFKSAIEAFHHTVMIVTNWKDPLPLKRAWCLFEIYCTAITNSSFDIAMSSNQQVSFLAEMKDGKSNETLNDMFSNINVLKSQSSVQEDRERIFDVIKTSIGFDKINKTILEKMRNWITIAAEELLMKISGATEGSPLFKEGQEEEYYNIKSVMASIHFHQGKHETAETLYLECFNERKRIIGIEHVSTLRTMYDLSLVSFFLRKDNLALPYVEECYTLRKKLLGEDHTDTLLALCLFARLHNSTANFVKAEALFEECLKKQTKILGPRHRNTLDTMLAYSRCYNGQGKLKEGEELLRPCCTLKEEVLGFDHPDTLAAKWDLADLYQGRGKSEEAANLYAMIYEERKRIFGDDHIKTIQSYLQLTTMCEEKGENDEAERIYKDCYEKCVIAFGETHVETLLIEKSYATFLYSTRNDFPQAETIFLKILINLEEKLGKTHFDVIPTLETLSTFYYQWGKYEKSKEYGEKALALNRMIYGEKHPNYINMLETLGSLYLQLSNNDLCYEYYYTCYEYWMNKVEKENHPTICNLLLSLGMITERLGDREKATEYYEKALKNYIETFGIEHQDTLNAKYNVAIFYSNCGEYERALLLYEESFEGRKRLLGEGHLDTLNAMSGVASIYGNAGMYDEAIELYEECFSLQIKTLGNEHPYALTTMYSCSQCYFGADMFVKSSDLAKKCYEQRCDVFGADHPQTKAAENLWIKAKSKLPQVAEDKIVTPKDTTVTPKDTIMEVKGSGTKEKNKKCVIS